MLNALNKRRQILAPLGFGLALLSACSSHSHPPRPTFSPNGEPLLPPQWPRACEDALGIWFDRIDANHDQRLTLAELEADAAAQFQVMDLRHDGKVTAEELSTYRLKMMGGHFLSVSTPDQKSTIERRETDDDGPGYGDSRYPDPRERRRDDETRRKTDAFGALTTDQPDPVMSADSDLDGSVTWDEFRALVAQNFADLDHGHAGAIGKSDVQGFCERYKD
jgi:hypothetical protein